MIKSTSPSHHQKKKNPPPPLLQRQSLATRTNFVVKFVLQNKIITYFENLTVELHVLILYSQYTSQILCQLEYYLQYYP